MRSPVRLPVGSRQSRVAAHAKHGSPHPRETVRANRRGRAATGGYPHQEWCLRDGGITPARRLCSEPGPPIAGYIAHKEEDEEDDKDSAKNADTRRGYFFVLCVRGNRWCRRHDVRLGVPERRAARPFDGCPARLVWCLWLRLLLWRRGWQGACVRLRKTGVVYRQPAQATALGADRRGVELGSAPLTVLAPAWLAALGAPDDPWPLHARLPALQAGPPQVAVAGGALPRPGRAGLAGWCGLYLGHGPTYSIGQPSYSPIASLSAATNRIVSLITTAICWRWVIFASFSLPEPHPGPFRFYRVYLPTRFQPRR